MVVARVVAAVMGLRVVDMAASVGHEAVPLYPQRIEFSVEAVVRPYLLTYPTLLYIRIHLAGHLIACTVLENYVQLESLQEVSHT